MVFGRNAGLGLSNAKELSSFSNKQLGLTDRADQPLRSQTNNRPETSGGWCTVPWACESASGLNGMSTALTVRAQPALETTELNGSERGH
ncbi:unnamed protein product [Boreogadus saida]